MPRKAQSLSANAPLAPVPREVLDQFVRDGPLSPEELDDAVPIDVPRDREGTFEPKLIGKHERRFTGFDDKGIARNARGMTVREIQAFLAEMYPVVFFDALRVKTRDEATVRSTAVSVALGVRPDGTRDRLGLWIEQTEGAKFWMKVLTDLRTRGCQDILIAVTDGLKGMPEALAANRSTIVAAAPSRTPWPQYRAATPSRNRPRPSRPAAL